MKNEREKAIEIYNRFRNENSVMTANIRAKKQALIAVDEILKTFDVTMPQSIEYWQKVKEEIEKL